MTARKAPGFLHVLAFRPDAVHVPPEGNPLGSKYRLGDWQCVMCRAAYGFIERYDLDHGGDCPGLVRPAGQETAL